MVARNQVGLGEERLGRGMRGGGVFQVKEIQYNTMKKIMGSEHLCWILKCYI